MTPTVNTTLRAPTLAAIVDLTTGKATDQFTKYLNALNAAIPTPTVLVLSDFGATGNGTTDDTLALQNAISTAAKQGGAVIVAAPGTYAIGTVTFPSGSGPITLAGSGPATEFLRNQDLAAGAGLFDILGSNVTLRDFAIDGDVTVPVGLLYNSGFSTGIEANDPMAPSLTKNTSIWVHGPASNFTMQGVLIQHTGGYSTLLDALSGAITAVRIINCQFSNNRPHLFGVTAGAEIYGSWTGGILCMGDGRSANPGRTIAQFLVQGCVFSRGTGNQVWQNLYGLDNLHRGYQVLDSFFEDIGLDGILAGGVIGGTVSGNVLHRIGYITMTDTDAPVPRWLPNLNATAIDSSGLVIGCNYQGNSIISANGGGLDLDGHCDSSLSGNLVRIPIVGDPDYASDFIATSGVSNSGSTSYAINLGNTANTPQGGQNVTIEGNTILNMAAGSVRLYSARNCLVTANDIVAPNAPITPPITMGPGGPGANQRSTGNIIKGNRFAYSPAISAPFCFEDPSVAPFMASDKNFVFSNNPIIGASGLATEFLPNGSSSSPTYSMQVWF